MPTLSLKEVYFSEQDNFAANLVQALKLEPNNKFLKKAYGKLTGSSSAGELTPKERIAASRIFRKLNLEIYLKQEKILLSKF